MRNKQACNVQDAQLSPELKTWLYASGSLTQQLTELADGEFSVKPI